MKVLNLYSIGDLRCEDKEVPIARKNEVLLEIRASGICGSDLPRIFHKGTYHFPTVPGHEFAGRVVELGEGVDTSLLGRRFAVFPLLPCFECECCAVGEYASCKSYGYFGSRQDGGFAEYIAVPVWNLVPIPDSLSYEEAAMCEPAAVAVHALRRAGVELGDCVAIFGAGPIGLMLASFARLWGAFRTVLVDINAKKLEFAESLGFRDAINASESDAVKEIMSLTGGRGADLCIEGAGVSKTLEQCLFSCRPFGRVVAMGNPAGDMALSQKGYWELLRKQLTLSGTWNSSFVSLPKNDWHLAIQSMDGGAIDVKRFITHRFDMKDYKKVFEMMNDKDAFYNKVMFTMEDKI
ncbi:MAG: galactitol-1-phosphate 5-dehydrogenase [Eubacteriales bacterium]